MSDGQEEYEAGLRRDHGARAKGEDRLTAEDVAVFTMALRDERHKSDSPLQIDAKYDAAIWAGYNAIFGRDSDGKPSGEFPKTFEEFKGRAVSDYSKLVEFCHAQAPKGSGNKMEYIPFSRRTALTGSVGIDAALPFIEKGNSVGSNPGDVALQIAELYKRAFAAVEAERAAQVIR